MDIHTLTRVIQELKKNHRFASDAYNMHSSDPYYEGKVVSAYEALRAVEIMLQDEVDYREEHA